MAQMACKFKQIAKVSLDTAITTTQGFHEYIYSTFQLEAKKMYLFQIDGNSATDTYKGLQCVKYQQDVGVASTANTIYVRDANATTTASDSWLFNVNAGSTITVYEL